MADFTYIPNESSEDAKFEIDAVRFGDGYTHRIPIGINNGLRRWSVQFLNRSLADADAIVEFFRTRNGATSFSWRPQGYAADVRVVCVSYSKPIKNQWIDGSFVYDVTATFEETPL